MESLGHYFETPRACSYLPDQRARLEYEQVGSIAPEEYEQRLDEGWRRFGHLLFRPRCRSCDACRPLRIDVERFRPDRSMTRLRRRNQGTVSLSIEPAPRRPSRDAFELFRRYQRHQAASRGWPDHSGEDRLGFVASFLHNPFETEQWTYRIGDRLVAVSYVDRLPRSFSAIYCFYDPELRHHAPGTWNILCMIEGAGAAGVPHLHLGYYVADCPSLSYKERFRPNEIRSADGRWSPFRS